MIKMKHREKDIPKQKLETVNNISDLMKNSRSIIVVSVKNIPAKQLQLISKNLREKGQIKVTKKSLIERAIDSIEKGTIKNLKKYLRENTAFLFSDINPFELSAILSENKSKAKAKVGQKVDESVSIEPGPTELVPGPVISQLGSLGIKFEIKQGKIEITEKKHLLNSGENVDENTADIMSKLDIKPVSVGLTPIAAYDSELDKIYEDIIIDKQKTLDLLKQAYSKGLAFAVSISYPVKQTLSFILGKASIHEKAIENLIKSEPEQKTEKQGKEKTEKTKQENKEKIENNPQENKPEEKGEKEK